MEEDPFAPLSDFTPKRLKGHDYMELVWENGQILTRGWRSRVYSTRNPPRATSLIDLHGDEGDPDMNPGDTQVVPAGETPSSNTKLPPCEENDKTTKEKIRLSAAAHHNKNAATQVEPEILEKEKERDDDVVESTAHVLKAMADQTHHKKLEFSPPDAQSVAMGRSWAREKVGSVDEERESSDSMISSLRRTCTESKGSTDLSSNMDDESGDEGPQVPARTRKTAKRKQSEDFDDLSERERRHAIKKRMLALRRLLPNNCSKDNKSSLLDEAIKYTRKLQLQFRLMSMANAFLTPQMMCYSPLVHSSPLGLGFGTPPFVPSPVPGATLPNQPGPVPLSPFSFYPIESSSQQCVPPAASSPQFQWCRF